jgi:CheY-like chemotaxis protein
MIFSLPFLIPQVRSEMPRLDRIFAIIVEDDYSSVEVLAQFLEFLGIQFHVVPQGIDILAVVQKFAAVNVIFLDLELAGHNGYTVLNSIRSNPSLDSIPVVAYTSHTDQKSRAYKAGFHSFLAKPLDGIAFPNQLRRILSNEAVWD